MAKFTFKKSISTGRYRSFELDSTTIKIKRKMVGNICQTRRDERVYEIRFAIKRLRTEKDPAPFKWITLKKKCTSEPEAKEFLRKYEKEIQEKYDLYHFED